MHCCDFHKALLLTLSIVSIRWWRRWMLRFRCILHYTISPLNLSLRIWDFGFASKWMLQLMKECAALLYGAANSEQCSQLQYILLDFAGCGSTYLHAHWSVNIHSFCYLNISWIDVPACAHEHTHFRKRAENSFTCPQGAWRFSWHTRQSMYSVLNTIHLHCRATSFSYRLARKEMCIFSVIRFFNF